MFVLCQSAPVLEKVDEGIKRRIITIPFNVQFVDNPIDEFQEKKVIFTNEGKEKLKYSVLDLLTKAYINLYNNNYKFDIPEIFQRYKDDYIDECNLVDQCILESFEYCQNGRIKSMEVIEYLKEHNLTPKEIKSKMKKLLNSDVIKRKDGNYYNNVKFSD